MFFFTRGCGSLYQRKESVWIGGGRARMSSPTGRHTFLTPAGIIRSRTSPSAHWQVERARRPPRCSEEGVLAELGPRCREKGFKNVSKAPLQFVATLSPVLHPFSTADAIMFPSSQGKEKKK